MKKQMKQEIPDSCWMTALDGMTIQEAISWLSKYPDSATLDYSRTGYEDWETCIYALREETDEEYERRIAREAEVERKRQERNQRRIEREREEKQNQIEKLETEVKKLKGNL